MAIEFSNTTRVHTVWFSGAKGIDLLGTVMKDDEAAAWKLVFRTREHVDHHVFDSNDIKHWYEAHGKDGSDATRDELVASMDRVATLFKRHYGNGTLVDEVREVINCDGTGFSTFMAAQRFCQTRFEGTIPEPARPQ